MPRPSATLTLQETGPVEIEKIYDAEIETGATEPDGEVWVFIPDLDDGKHRHGPLVWNAAVNEDGIFYPKAGASAMVARAKETGDLWLVQFEPQGEPDASLGGGTADKTSGIGVIIHGEDEATARGTDYAHYIWIGSAEPENATEFDFWANPPE